MDLILHERRTKTKLVNGLVECEDDCMLCSAQNTVYQLEPLKPNTHGQKDNRGNIMMEHRVSCLSCGEEWVDVFCRVYPDKENVGV